METHGDLTWHTPRPYEVLRAVGAGGMGEVYKARDTRLERILAIKVLVAHLADNLNLRTQPSN